MDGIIKAALDKGGIADITTMGRKTGTPRRKEIYFHSLDGRLYLTGKPGFRRDWLANLHAHPGFTLHLKRGVAADLPAIATPISDPAERAAVIFQARTESWGADPTEARADLDFWVETSPLVRFEVAEPD
jgi:deazaflavin-dependent oxidoreductase (nitroreductase family)